MIGTFLSRTLLLIFGYGYPAYECFKEVETSKPEIKQLIFWCQYWILVATLTICERVGDNLISWLPMYSEAKLAFFIYLWHKKTRGTTYVYKCFFQPFMTKHETKIDHSLLKLKVRGWDIALLYCKKIATHWQAKFFEILQYSSSQSALQLHSDKQEPNSTEAHVSETTAQTPKERQSKEPKTHSQQQPHEPSTEREKKTNHEPFSSIDDGNSKSSQQETVSKESVQLHHSRWRLFHSASKHKRKK